MKDFNRLAKKYFILLLIFLPLSRLVYGLTIRYGQEAILEYFGTYDLYIEKYDYFCWVVETINKYLIYLILSIFVLIDLKQSKNIFAIPFLTALNPIYGVTLLLIFQYAIVTNKLMLDMKQNLKSLINKYAIIISILNLTEVLLYNFDLLPYTGIVINYFISNIILTVFVAIDLKKNHLRNPIIVFSSFLFGIIGAILLLIQVSNTERQTSTE